MLKAIQNTTETLDLLSDQEKAQVVKNAIKQLSAQRLEAAINTTLNRVRIENTLEGKRQQQADVERFVAQAASISKGIDALMVEYAEILATPEETNEVN